MQPVFKKLNYSNHAVLHVLNSPATFHTCMEEMGALANLKTAIRANEKAFFILAFCTKQSEVNHYAELAAKTLEGDGLLWFAYPKKTSKNFTCSFNRDNGWESLGRLGYEPVRMVAIDEDWSALRFRKLEFIKNFTRSSAISEPGKVRLSKK